MTRFTNDDLKAKGFVEDGKGGWIRPSIKKNNNEITGHALPNVKWTGTTFIKHDEAVSFIKKNGIFVPYQTPSKKNSRALINHPKTGEAIMIPSKQMKEYLIATRSYWIHLSVDFKRSIETKEMPYQILFLFVRSTKQHFDYVGPLETVQDLMKDKNWIPDDDVRTMKPILLDFEVDRNKPGVYIAAL